MSSFNPLEIGSTLQMGEVGRGTVLYELSFNPLEIGSTLQILSHRTGGWLQKCGFNPLEIGSTLQMRGVVSVGVPVPFYEFQSPRNRVNTSNGLKAKSYYDTAFPEVSIP